MKTLLLVAIATLAFNTAQAADFPQVIVQTNKGTFTLELNDEKAPISVQNFLEYVDSKFYDETIFHRVIKTFVIQGGGLDVNMVEKPTRAAIVNEAKNGLSNLKGTIGMARESDPNTATAQFYINTKDNTGLDYRDDAHFGYAVFGRVTDGADVIDAIAGVATHSVGEYDDVPVDPVVVSTIRRK